MRDYFKPKTWLITILMLIIAIGFSSAVVYYEFGLEKNIKITRASAGDNVTGWAWNANTGWISFNCTGDTPACGASDYGVKIDLDTGYFSGYAWSSGVGWISFNRKTCDNVSDNGMYCEKDQDCHQGGHCRLDGPGAAGAPLSAPYNSPASLDYNAIYSFSAKTVTGWAKILSLGDNGWIKFNGNRQDGQPWAPGVSIDPATGSASGWAWNANDNGSGIGWISFNCANESPTCSGTNYKVIANINRPPTVVNMTAPNWNYTEAAGVLGALNANLNFRFVDNDSGSFGSKYQLIVKKSDDTPVLDTGECTAYNTPSASCKIYNATCMENGSTGCVESANCVCQYPLAEELNYGTGYKWSVKVWDNYGASSTLTWYNTNPDRPLVADDQVIPTFTTYKHNFSLPNSDPFPAEPSQGEKVRFTDASQRFFSAPPVNNPTTAVACTSATCDWKWTVPVNATIDDDATSTPIIVFNSTGINNVKLRVTDETDTGNTPYYTEKIIEVEVRAKLPGWREVKPE